jgi:hypothetical protein
LDSLDHGQWDRDVAVGRNLAQPIVAAGLVIVSRRARADGAVVAIRELGLAVGDPYIENVASDFEDLWKSGAVLGRTITLLREMVLGAWKPISQPARARTRRNGETRRVLPGGIRARSSPVVVRRDSVCDNGLVAEAVGLALAILAAHACADGAEDIAGVKAVGTGAVDPVAAVIGGGYRGDQKMYQEEWEEEREEELTVKVKKGGHFGCVLVIS